MTAWQYLLSKSSLLAGTAWQHLNSALQIGEGTGTGTATSVSVSITQLTVDIDTSGATLNLPAQLATTEVSQTTGLIASKNELGVSI